ncbi:MAG: hypothetical protein ACFFH0_12295, partial [Promethearchaeota archaeon]
MILSRKLHYKDGGVKGDKLVINEGHVRAANQALELLLSGIDSTQGRYVITIAGESGSGKSEIA